MAAALALVLSITSNVQAGAPPELGKKAPDFSLKTLDDKEVSLNDLLSTNQVVLIVLRGWPGYQCPLCTAQVQDYISAAAAFTKMKTRVLMVYPGPAPQLQAHAKDFLKDKQWPADFVYVVDPDFKMVNAYGLRWDAPRETAYPSTFVLDGKGIVRFAKISHSHGDRTQAREVLAEVKRITRE
jgi:peroxiredoxin